TGSAEEDIDKIIQANKSGNDLIHSIRCNMKVSISSYIPSETITSINATYTRILEDALIISKPDDGSQDYILVKNGQVNKLKYGFDSQGHPYNSASITGNNGSRQGDCDL